MQWQGSFPSALATASNLTVLDVSSNLLRRAQDALPFCAASTLSEEGMHGVALTSGKMTATPSSG